jgi:hypothetical protein
VGDTSTLKIPAKNKSAFIVVLIGAPGLSTCQTCLFLLTVVERNGDRRWHGSETDSKKSRETPGNAEKRMQKPIQALELPNMKKKEKRERFLEPLGISDGSRCRS